MAGQTDGDFKEKLSPFLRSKYRELQISPETDPDALAAIALQYLRDTREASVLPGEVGRHYEADLRPSFEGQALRGVERLYRRSIVVEPTMVCAAHCRWCVRGQYDFFHLADDELERIVRYIGQAPENEDVREVLITGGDPLVGHRQLRLLLDELERHAPRIEIYRIATRVPLHQPNLVTDALLSLFRRHADRVEIALHVNHETELFLEVRDALTALRATGVKLYNQTVLLRGLNDSLDILSRLADALRELRVEMHYLFHGVPLRGMAHHRTSLDRGLELARGLTACGQFSGRAKPTFAVLTDVGKIVPYEGTILQRRGDRVLLQSHYDLRERLSYLPEWQVPDSASVDEHGLLRVWYRDAVEDASASAA